MIPYVPGSLATVPFNADNQTSNGHIAPYTPVPVQMVPSNPVMSSTPFFHQNIPLQLPFQFATPVQTVYVPVQTFQPPPSAPRVGLTMSSYVAPGGIPTSPYAYCSQPIPGQQMWLPPNTPHYSFANTAPLQQSAPQPTNAPTAANNQFGHQQPPNYQPIPINPHANSLQNQIIANPAGLPSIHPHPVPANPYQPTAVQPLQQQTGGSALNSQNQTFSSLQQQACVKSNPTIHQGDDIGGKAEVSSVLSKKPCDRKRKLQEDSFGTSKSSSTKKSSKKRRTSCSCPNCLPSVPTSSTPGSPASVNSQPRVHLCHLPDCGRSYGKTSHLRAHLRWHNNDRPFACHYPSCTKTFTRSDQLQRHHRIHLGIKSFVCSLCSRCFIRSDHLIKHTRIHDPANVEAKRSAGRSRTNKPKEKKHTWKTEQAAADTTTPSLAQSTSSQEHQDSDIKPDTSSQASPTLPQSSLSNNSLSQPESSAFRPPITSANGTPSTSAPTSLGEQTNSLMSNPSSLSGRHSPKPVYTILQIATSRSSEIFNNSYHGSMLLSDQSTPYRNAYPSVTAHSLQHQHQFSLATAPYQQKSPIVTTQASPYQQQSPIVTTQISTYQQQSPIITAHTLPYPQQSSIVTSQASPYQQLSPIVTTHASTYQQQSPIVKTPASPYPQQSPVVTTHASPYQQQSPIVMTHASPYQQQSPIVKTPTSPYPQQSPIVMTHASPYQQQSPIVTTHASPYLQQSPMVTTHALRYKQQSPIVTTQSLPYQHQSQSFTYQQQFPLATTQSSPYQQQSLVTSQPLPYSHPFSLTSNPSSLYQQQLSIATSYQHQFPISNAHTSHQHQFPLSTAPLLPYQQPFPLSTFHSSPYQPQFNPATQLLLYQQQPTLAKTSTADIITPQVQTHTNGSNGSFCAQ